MRIQRNRSGLMFRTRRRRRWPGGCLPLVLALGLLISVGPLALQWIETRLSLVSAPINGGDLRAAQAAFDAGDLDAAILTASQLWNAQPDRVDALLLLARALIYRSYADYDRDIDRLTALQFTSAALDRLPDDVDVQAIHAFALQAGGQPVTAARIAEQTLRQQPEHTLARIALGLAYGRVGGFESALRENQAAFDNDSVQWALDAHRALAISLHDVGRYREAARTADAAIAINSRLPVLHFERALYAMQTGDMDRATAAYFRVLAFDPDNIKARLRLCEVSGLLAERDTAIRYCLEVTEAAPTWADGWHRLGREYFLKGDFASARDSLRRCTTLLTAQQIPIRQRPFECWYLQGQAAELLGDCDTLLYTYHEFKAMAAEANLPQTWTYPPEGPEICLPADYEP